MFHLTITIGLSHSSAVQSRLSKGPALVGGCDSSEMLQWVARAPTANVAHLFRCQVLGRPDYTQRRYSLARAWSPRFRAFLGVRLDNRCTIRCVRL